MTTVFFPGKFQPPHIGHVVTIAKLLSNDSFDKLVVGITEDTPKVMEPIQIKKIFDTIFDHARKWKTIDVVLIGGVLTEKKDNKELPPFDILISGNKKVIDWGKSIGLETQYFSRSEGIGYSGTELRGLYQGGR